MTQVIERKDIGLVEPKSRTKFGKTPKGLAWHWEGGGTPEANLEDSKKTLRGIQRSHLNNKAEGYVDIAYCIGFDCLGNIFILRGWDVQGGANGTTQANRDYVSVVYLSGPGEPLTDAAKEAAAVIRGMANGHGIGSDNQPHSKFKSTACPGDELRNFIKTLGSAPAPANQASTPSLPSWGGFPLPSGHYFGVINRGDSKNHSGTGNTRDQGFIKMIQREVSVVDDGIYGEKTKAAVINYQKARGIPADGLFGQQSWNAK